MERLKIPHLLRFSDGMSALLTIPGRPPLCLKCSRVGHVRRVCPSNMNVSSYAAAARSRDSDSTSRMETVENGVEIELEKVVENKELDVEEKDNYI